MSYKPFGHLTNIPDRKKYKTDTGWLRAVYRNNRDFIDQRAGDFKTFKTAVTDYQVDRPGTTIRQALGKLSRSSAAGFQARNELQQGLFGNAMKGKLQEFKRNTGERFNPSNLHYNSQTKEWDYITNEGKTVAHFSDIRKTGYRAGKAQYRTH